MSFAVVAVAVGFAGMGLIALLRPAYIGSFFNVRFDSVDGRNEARAVYGGFGLAIALALVIALEQQPLRAGIIVCVSLALAGMAAGRLLSAVLERPGRWPWIFCGIESGGAALLWFSLG